jgi:hypothetical protein
MEDIVQILQDGFDEFERTDVFDFNRFDPEGYMTRASQRSDSP